MNVKPNKTEVEHALKVLEVTMQELKEIAASRTNMNVKIQKKTFERFWEVQDEQMRVLKVAFLDYT